MPISSIKGTGPDGSIVKADIEDYLGNSFSLCWAVGTDNFINFFVLLSLFVHICLYFELLL